MFRLLQRSCLCSVGLSNSVWKTSRLNLKNYLLKSVRTPAMSSTARCLGGRTDFLAPRYEEAQYNVWVEYTKLAMESGAVNLGQGMPDYPPPRYINDALINVMQNEHPRFNQYTRPFGHPRLINILGKLYSQLMGRQINPLTDMLITVGAYGSLFCAISSLVKPGDEVIIIEPFFDCYLPMVKIAGGKPVTISLRPDPSQSLSEMTSDDWKIDFNELDSLITNKTKMIILNNPHNPLGKVFRQDELERIAQLCQKHDLLCVSDEVYEWLVYPSSGKHIRIATLPGMWERTLTIGSAGKTFSVTGWKLGWTIGPPHLLHCCQVAHQNSVYTCATPLQEAVAICMEKEIERLGSPQCYFNELGSELALKRDYLVDILRKCGMKPVVPQAGYFLIADWSNVDVSLPANTSEPRKDARFVKWITQQAKIAAIPPSYFYSSGHTHLADDLIRFCFFKKDTTLKEAGKLFGQHLKPKQ